MRGALQTHLSRFPSLLTVWGHRGREEAVGQGLGLKPDFTAAPYVLLGQLPNLSGLSYSCIYKIVTLILFLTSCCEDEKEDEDKKALTLPSLPGHFPSAGLDDDPPILSAQIQLPAMETNNNQTLLRAQK